MRDEYRKLKLGKYYGMCVRDERKGRRNPSVRLSQMVGTFTLFRSGLTEGTISRS